MAVAREAARKQRVANGWSKPRPIPSPAEAEHGIDFTAEVQTAIRARLRDLLAHLAELTARKSPDWSQVDRLASAIERIAELERQLDGRPLPGSRRPPREDPPSARASQRRGPAVPMSSQPPAPAPIEGAPDDDEPPLYQPAPID